MQRNILLTIAYEGTRYCGWQMQLNEESVQQTVERALAPIAGAVRLKAAGRTDAGVHAEAMPATFATEAEHAPAAFLSSANANLPEDIAVLDAREVDARFDARRSARLRWYRYRIRAGGPRPVFERTRILHLRSRPDPARAMEAAALFEGRHDFAGFRSALCSARRTVLDMQECVLTVSGADWTLDFRCRSFLHNMVRTLTGAILETARGKLTPGDLRRSLETGERDSRIPTAPAHGLTLMAVGYPPDTAS